MKKLFILLLIAHALIAQNVPFIMEHPVYHFLERSESRGLIRTENWSTRPYTLTQINEMLDEIAEHSADLSSKDLKLLNRFQLELNRDFQKEGITFPWSESTLKRLTHPSKQTVKPFFMTYRQGDSKGWINWSETFRVQNNGHTSRGYHTDHLDISGSKGAIAFTTQYHFHRITRNDEFSEIPSTYKEGLLLDREYMKWINWGYPTSSLIFNHDDFDIGIHRQPIYWGYSKTNSPILSDNVYPLPQVQWKTEIRHLRFMFLHARLSPNTALITDTLNDRRNLSAHRVEFDINPNFEFAFNEMVIYAYRDFELGYLNPVNFLFAEEQTQGDLDNKLMAIDFKWRVHTGLTTYGSWFFDELDFWKLFSGWWGNKFVFQLGATYYPHSNLPSINFEYTAARPWTYSHSNTVNSYTSAGRLLGLKDGPNTESFLLRLEWLVNPYFYITGDYKYLKRGDDPGANALLSYDERVISDEVEDSHFLSGSIDRTTFTSISLHYYLANTISLNANLINDDIIEIGMKIDW
ncbi:MAG: hypothetical protein HOG76_07365 [Candidatus Marinimicrobia bacterium]|nr:hypothetical protein [Candidatus Neomarinimicrobiota bacterium]MBT4419543.1 hypothetical protein [Candidatus Neomarinimicrobiota bacterium]MBT6002635.1 hypothetical protein [Candidatus Neomarinimicrobiota bacterium]MBT6760286.1 hypothetical protein [Candidatus Neomarinimicrobiota bacterium]